MSTCISSHGEYGSHEIPSDLGEFVCNRCVAFDESAALTALARARFDLDHTAALERERIAAYVESEPTKRAYLIAFKGDQVVGKSDESEFPMTVAEIVAAIRAGAHNTTALATEEA